MTILENASTNQQETAPDTIVEQDQSAQNTEQRVAEPTPEQQQASEVQRLSEERRKLDGQLHAMKREQERHEKTKAENLRMQEQLTAQQAKIDALVSFDDVSQYIAQRRGISVRDLHAEWAGELNNGGKPPADTQTKRELEALKREMANERKARTEREQKELEAATAREQKEWGDSVDAMLGFKNGIPSESAQQRWPKLMANSQVVVVRNLLALTNQFMRDNGGKLPDQTQLLDFAESEIEVPEPRKPIGEAEKPAKPNAQRSADSKFRAGPKVVNGQDSRGSGAPRPQTDAERRAAAIARFESMTDDG